MKLVIFGLSVSSSWGNGHATLWRGLISALAKRGHEVVFFERDVSWYAAHRDLFELPGGGKLILYPEWSDVAAVAAEHLRDADTAMLTSYCPDSHSASRLVLDSRAGVRAFYDLDSPVTLDRLEQSLPVDYVPAGGYCEFDVVLSYAGGRTLTALRERLGARRAVALYGSVDPAIHKPADPVAEYRADLSYMGTYSRDRDETLHLLFIEPARRLPSRRFVIGGSMYDGAFPWQPNIFWLQHVEPDRHSAFYCSSQVTLNVTRSAMARMGYCPSGRLFEAAACGVPVLSDWWEGLEHFYEPGSEILIGRSVEDAMDALGLSGEELSRLGRNARERTLAEHTAERRAIEMENILQSTFSPEVTVACGA